jgi:hypothetical protein
MSNLRITLKDCNQYLVDLWEEAVVSRVEVAVLENAWNLKNDAAII